MKKLLAILVALVVAIIVVIASRGKDQDQQPAPIQTGPVAGISSPTPHDQIHMHEYAVKGRVPAFYETAPATLPNTLSPEAFTGNTRLAYQAAKEIPQVLAQLPCYCHCDRGHGHKSLHSCFESEHGENCGICINEALMAYNLQKHEVSVSEIRKQIIAAYGR